MQINQLNKQKLLISNPNFQQEQRFDYLIEITMFIHWLFGKTTYKTESYAFCYVLVITSNSIFDIMIKDQRFQDQR